MSGNGKRGVFYTFDRKGREQEESLVHLERWEPHQTDIACKECGEICNEKLNEYSVLTTYRCSNGHKNFRIFGKKVFEA